MKTENIANVGKHAFEVAGLGLAPFQFVGASENVITYPDGSQKAGGCCDYCFTGIRLECHVQSADGKQFKVGCNCITKVGDVGLLKAYKQSKEFRAHQRELKQKRYAIARQQVEIYIAANEATLKAKPHPMGFTDYKTGTPLTALDNIKWQFQHFGQSAMIALAKALTKNILLVA